MILHILFEAPVLITMWLLSDYQFITVMSSHIIPSALRVHRLMIDKSATSDMAVKSKIRALTCIEERKNVGKFLLEKSLKHWGCLDARKLKRGALHQCCNTRIV